MLPETPRSPGCPAVKHSRENHWPMPWAGTSMTNLQRQARTRRICYGKHQFFRHLVKTSLRLPHHGLARTTGLPVRAASSKVCAGFWCVRLALTAHRWPSWGTGGTALPCAARERPLCIAIARLKVNYENFHGNQPASTSAQRIGHRVYREHGPERVLG